MNNITLCGNVTRTPEKITTKNGTALTKFTLAVNTHNKDTDYFTIICFGKTAEYVASYIDKGSKVGVVGSIHIKEFTTKDNKKAKDIEVEASSVHNFTPIPKATDDIPDLGRTDEIDDDDLPF